MNINDCFSTKENLSAQKTESNQIIFFQEMGINYPL